MSQPRYSIGIDLGTTNSGLSFYDLSLPAEQPRDRAESTLSIPQLTAVGTVEDRPLLPSFLYLPSPEEFPGGRPGPPLGPGFA